MEPRQSAARINVAKNVTVDDRSTCGMSVQCRVYRLCLTYCTHINMKNYCKEKLEEVDPWCLVVLTKYKQTQLPFDDQMRVFDPRQQDSMTRIMISQSFLLRRNGCFVLQSGIPKQKQ